MTAPTRSTVSIFASASVAPGGTKAAPGAGAGAWVDVRGLNGGLIAWSVKNGSSAPGVQGQFTLQVADAAGDGSVNAANATDLWTAGGDIVASSESSGTVELPSSAAYVRALNYGHTTNSVTFRHVLFGKG